MFSSVFAWIFGNSRSRCAFAASASSSIEVMPSSLWMIRAVAGPTPGTRSSVMRPCGTAALSSACRFDSPVVTSCVIASVTDGPVLGISARRPCSSSSDTGSRRSRIERATWR